MGSVYTFGLPSCRNTSWVFIVLLWTTSSRVHISVNHQCYLLSRSRVHWWHCSHKRNRYWLDSHVGCILHSLYINSSTLDSNCHTWPCCFSYFNLDWLKATTVSGSAEQDSIETWVKVFQNLIRIHTPPFLVQRMKFREKLELSTLVSSSAGYPVQRDPG